MNQEESPQEKELLALIERFQEMKQEGKTLYLDAEQYEDIIAYHIFGKNIKSAVETVEAALQIHPDNAKLVLTRVALYVDERKLIEAREMLNKILDDGSFHIRLMHAELLFLEGKEKEADAVIDSFDKENLDEIDCLDVGILCNDIEFNKKALYWLEKSLSINPENEETILNLCEYHQRMGQYETTIPLYNKLIDKDPYAADYWSGLGESYFYSGQFDKAIEACDFALVINDKIGEAYTIKGHAYYQLDNCPESVEAYKKAWELGALDPEFAPTFIAFSYIGMEDWDKAYEYIRMSMETTSENSPVYPEILVNLARCLFYLDRKEEAHSTLESVQEHFPNNIHSYVYNGKFYLKEGNRDKALENYKKAIDVSPTANTWYQIGLSAIKSEDYEIARDAFEHVEDINPNYENLTENINYVTDKLLGEENLVLNRKMLKERFRSLSANGGFSPETLDIEACIREAKKEGKSEEEILSLVEALESLNDLLENFNIDQEEDELEDEYDDEFDDEFDDEIKDQ
jgi:tetratricopeptide (TPR) repeat protein